MLGLCGCKMCWDYIELRQNVSGGSRPIRHTKCDDSADSRIADGPPKLSISVHDTRSLFWPVNLLIIVEGLRENSDDVPKWKPLAFKQPAATSALEENEPSIPRICLRLPQKLRRLGDVRRDLIHRRRLQKMNPKQFSAWGSCAVAPQ